MLTKNNQKILIISYHFPPDNRVGAIRTTKFAKYLSRIGWQPYILTIKEKYIPFKEYDRLKETRDIQIIRTAVWPTAIQLLLRIRNKIFSFFKIEKNAEPSISSVWAASNDVKKNNAGVFRSFISSVKRYLVSILELPDDVNGWLIPAIWKGYWLIKREKIQIVMTSSPPMTTALVGLFLSRLTGVKLLTDLRDPWFLMRGKSESVRCKLSDKVEMWLEKQLMEKSKKVITTNDTYTHFLRTYYAFVCEDNFYTLHNGYDSEDFHGIESVKPSGKFTLSYLGTFYFTRTPKEFLFALSQLLEEGIISRHELEVNFIGHVRFSNGGPVEDMVKLYGLAGCVNIQDTLPYKKALFQMKRSDVLLLFAPDEQYYSIPGKTFEYIGAEKYILCFGNKGATADFIRRTECGIVVDAHDIDEIRNAIEDLYFKWKSGKVFDFKLGKYAFEREEQAKRLSELLLKL